MKRKLAKSAKRPEELVFQACYAPVDVAGLLESAETRSKIRRLPSVHLYYGTLELDDGQVQQLLPHVTEEQWREILDFDLWRRDRLLPVKFMAWQRHLLRAEDPVARKLIRAADPSLWQSALQGFLQIHPIDESDYLSVQVPPDREYLETPDHRFLIVLPRNPELARLTRLVLQRLYQLDPDQATLWLSEVLWRTPTEVEEQAYSDRKRRLEDLGFQDYFDALEIYTPLEAGANLPLKRSESNPVPSDLPVSPAPEIERRFLLFRALSQIRDPAAVLSLLEELFHVGNKIGAADRISPAEPERVKRSLRKAIFGINLGLDLWSAGDLERAVEGVRRHYLKPFFQIAYGRLRHLSEQARRCQQRRPPPPGTIEESFLEGLQARFPLLTVLAEGTIRRRLFRSRSDVGKASRLLRRLSGTSRGGF